MIIYTTGNLLEAKAEALVNTVNTVGVMGKGIALAFKKRFPNNMQAYAEACKNGEVQTGKMFVTENDDLLGAKWIINFPTKQHWRNSSKIEWVEEGLQDLRRFIIQNEVKSIAIPPLGSSNGKLNWQNVKPKIVDALGDLRDTKIIIYEPPTQGCVELTPARAMVLELIRRYSLIGMDCTQIEAQKLIYFLERSINLDNLDNPFKLNFKEYKYGPYDAKVMHALNNLKDSYLHIEEEKISINSFVYHLKLKNNEVSNIKNYLENGHREYASTIDKVTQIIKGFESPYGMELLATVDWLINKKNISPNMDDIKKSLQNWFSESEDTQWAERKLKIFEDDALKLAIERLEGFSYKSAEMSS